MYLILTTLWPWVDSASNRNEYQESSWGINDSWHVRLTTLSPSVSQLSRANVGALMPHSPVGLHGLFRLVGGGVQLGPLGTAATDWPIVACPG
jgi:hypothetical protein